MNALDQILTVLVLYEMRLADSPAYQSLGRAREGSNNKGLLFVFDNSAIAQVLPENTPWKILYYHDAANPGVSHAYNLSFIQAKKQNLKWLLLVDQDTVFPENIYEQYVQAMGCYPECQVFAPVLKDWKGIVSPFKPGVTSGKRLGTVMAGKKSLREIHAVNSGLMVECALFESAGGYDERLPLDFSDFIFFKKLQMHAREIVVVEATCTHELSSSKKNNLAAALKRFKIYLQGARVMSEYADAGFSFGFRAFLRAIKLSIHYRSIRFIGSLLSRPV